MAWDRYRTFRRVSTAFRRNVGRFAGITGTIYRYELLELTALRKREGGVFFFPPTLVDVGLFHWFWFNNVFDSGDRREGQNGEMPFYWGVVLLQGDGQCEVSSRLVKEEKDDERDSSIRPSMPDKMGRFRGSWAHVIWSGPCYHRIFKRGSWIVILQSLRY